MGQIREARRGPVGDGLDKVLIDDAPSVREPLGLLQDRCDVSKGGSRG